MRRPRPFTLAMLFCGVLMSGEGAIGQVPNPSQPASASAAGARAANPPVYRRPARLPQEVLSADELAAAKRLDDKLLDLVVESRLVPPGQSFSAADYKLGGFARYGDILQTVGQDPVVNLTIRAVTGELLDATLKRAATAVGRLPGVQVLGVASTPAYGLISAAVPPTQLLQAAAVAGVRQINTSGAILARAPLPSSASSPLATTADILPIPPLLIPDTEQVTQTLDIDDAKRVFPFLTGDGIRIGTLSDSANVLNGVPGDDAVGIAESQASGNLPPDNRIVVVQDDCCTDEGRGMMELEYDVLPGITRMGFATAFKSEAGFAENINALGELGMDVIVDDVFYYDEPFYQDGVIAQAVNNVVNAGHLYFTAGGNCANLSYESLWIDTDGDGYHEFGPGTDLASETLSVTVAGSGTQWMGIQWSQPWGDATTDLGVELWNANLTTKLASSTFNNLHGDPEEEWYVIAGYTYNFAVRYTPHAGDTPPAGLTFKMVFFDNGARSVTLNENTDKAAGTMTGHAGGGKAIAVGALPFYQRDTIESYSSRGPARHFFLPDGTPIEPVTFQKPDFVAVDGTNTSFFGRDITADPDSLPNFFGTSAAAPNAATVGALMLQAAGGSGSLNQEQVRDLLQRTAVDLGSPGFDTTYGAGRINALGAVVAARGPVPTEQVLYPNQFGDVSLGSNFYNDSDLDSYAVAFNAPGTVKANCSTSHTAMDPMVAVFQASDSAFLTLDYDSGGGTSSQASFDAFAGAVYKIEALSESPFSGVADYVLSVVGPSVTPMTLTPNSYGRVAYNGTLSGPGDLQYFQVVAPPEAVGGLTVRCAPVGYDGIVLLFDSAGKELARGDAYGSGVKDTLTWSKVYPNQTLVVLVASSGYSAGGDYALDIDFQNAPGQPLVLLPTPTSVIQTVRPNPVTGLFSFEHPPLLQGEAKHVLWVPDSETLTLQSDVLLDPGDLLSAGWYLPFGLRLAAAEQGQSATLNTITTPDLQRFHRVYGVRDLSMPTPPFVSGIHARSTYTESPPPKDLLDPVPLSPGGMGLLYETSAFSIEPAGDNDYFEILAPAESNGTLHLTLIPAGSLDGSLALYSSVGDLLMSANAAGAGQTETVSFKGVSPGARYYVRVSGAGNAISLSDSTQTGPYTFRADLGLTGPTPSPTPSPTVTLTPSPSPTLEPVRTEPPTPTATETITPSPTPSATPELTPSLTPTPTPTRTPTCGDVRVAFSFEAQGHVVPLYLNGGTASDIMLSGPVGALQMATVLVPHSQLIAAFDPHDRLNPSVPLTDVGLDAFDLISVPRYEGDPTPLRVFWSSETDFVTGLNSVLGPGILVQHGDLLTNTGAIYINQGLFSLFAPKDGNGNPIAGDFGLDAIDCAVSPDTFDGIAPTLHSQVGFELYFSFAGTARGGIVDQFIIGAGPDAGRTATHGDILMLPTVRIERTNAGLTQNMAGSGPQQGLDAIDLPGFDEKIETGPVTLGSGGWLFSVGEFETLTSYGQGDLLDESGARVLTNGQITGDIFNEYGLDEIDVVCWGYPPTPTPSPTFTPSPTPPPTGTPEPSPSPTATLEPTPTPGLGDTDKDGFADLYEVLQGSDPNDPASFPSPLDLTGDGTVDALDALLLYQMLSGAVPIDPIIYSEPFDFNLDGRTSLQDALLLYRNRLGLVPVLPATP